MGNEGGCCAFCDLPYSWVGLGPTLVRVGKYVYHALCWMADLAPGTRAARRAN